MRKINTDLPDSIYSWTITPLIDKINESSEDSLLDWNSWGGSTAAGQKFIDFLNNRENKLNINTTGQAVSMGAVLVPFFDHSKIANQADVMIHSLNGGVKSTRKHTNELLYGALSKKIDESKFKKLFDKELKEVMLAEGDDRVDVWMTGKQAAEIGLYDESYDLLDKAANHNKFDLTDIGYEIPEHIKEKYSKQAKIVKSNKVEMEIKDVTADMLKNGNKEAYDAIFNAGQKANQEKVAAIVPYMEHDPEKAKGMIEKGATLMPDDVKDFMEKKFAKVEIEELEANSEGDLKPGVKVAKVEDKRTPEEKEAAVALQLEKNAILEECEFEVKEDK